jgi:hypothetical protein
VQNVHFQYLLVALLAQPAAPLTVQEVAFGWHATEKGLEYHEQLSDSTKLSIYRGVLQAAHVAVARTWGEPQSWAEICGEEPESKTLTVALDDRIRSATMEFTVLEAIPDEWLQAFVADSLVDHICESGAVTVICDDSRATMTIGLSNIEPRGGGRVAVGLLMHRGRRACLTQNDTRVFSAELELLLEPAENGWQLVDGRMLWIT